METVRMWNQKWCGIEAISDDETWMRIITAYQFLSRITGWVLFRQDGTVYNEPDNQITEDCLLPPSDHLEKAIADFKSQNGKPGRAINNFMNKYL